MHPENSATNSNAPKRAGSGWLQFRLSTFLILVLAGGIGAGLYVVRTREHVIKLSDQNFQNVVLKSKKPVLVQFSADWCGPCRMIRPLVDEFAEESSWSVKVGRLDIDANPKVTQKYKVTAIPTFLVFQNGKEVKRLVGASDKARLQAALKSTGP